MLKTAGSGGNFGEGPHLQKLWQGGTAISTLVGLSRFKKTWSMFSLTEETLMFEKAIPSMR